MLVCTVSCQSVTLMSHTTCLSFVNVYVGTCPPICHIHVRYFLSLHVRQSVCDTPSCTHVFYLLLFFVSVCQYTCLSVTFIYTMPSTYVCVSVFLRSYVRISCSQLCIRASVCHIHVYYTSFSYISTTVCRSTRLCLCLFSCKYITCTVVCPSVCYIRAPSPQYVSVCLAVHSSKCRPCLSVSLFSFVSVTFIMHFVPPYMSECPPQSYVQHTSFCLDFFFASICCSINFIATCPSTYLSHSYAQCLPYVSVCVCVSLSLSVLRHYVGISCVQLCSSVTFMSCTCFHINSSYQLTCHACQSDCSSTMTAYSFSVNSSACFCFCKLFVSSLMPVQQVNMLQ